MAAPVSVEPGRPSPKDAEARWAVTVDFDRCAGSGMCAGLAAHHFGFDGGRSRPPAGPLDADEAVIAAAECCPMEAITVTEAGSGRPIFPEKPENGR
jgi:ferredoxin